MLVPIPPNVTLLVTFWQSTAKINFTRSGVRLKLRRRLAFRLYTLGLRIPSKDITRGASPNMNCPGLQNGPEAEVQGIAAPELVAPPAPALAVAT